MPTDNGLPQDFSLPLDAPDDLIIEDDDFLDHPDEFLEEEMIDEETQALFPLFPKGEDSDVSAEEWRELFEGDASLRSVAPRTAAVYAAAAYSGSGRDLGIADRLRAYGLKVVEIAGWQTRGSATFHPRGSVDHHTAGGLSGNAPSLNICTYGRSDLPGPLCQVLIGRDNTCYVIAAGRANHAGTGSWQGITGNSNVYGVEHENTGVGNEPWREDQRHTAALVHAALLHWRQDSSVVCEHKEWTTRKIDKWDQTGADMRSRTQRIWDGGNTPVPPNQEDDMNAAQEAKIDRLLASNTRIENELFIRVLKSLTRVENLHVPGIRKLIVDHDANEPEIDPAEIATLVLAGLDPAVIAAAIPHEIASDVVAAIKEQWAKP